MLLLHYLLIDYLITSILYSTVQHYYLLMTSPDKSPYAVVLLLRANI